MSLGESPYPVESLPTLGLPRNLRSWYFMRYKEATWWREFRCPKNQLDEFFSIGGNCLAFRSTTPVHFLRTTWKDEHYKIEFFDWKEKILEKNLRISPDPDRFFCLCKMYGNPNGTVVITRLSPDENTILVGLQDHNGIFIAIQPKSKPPYLDICKKFIYLALNRSRAQRLLQINGRRQKSYIPFYQNFCAKDHDDTTYYENWCWMCRGVVDHMVEKVSRFRENIRVCKCKRKDKVKFDPDYLWHFRTMVRDKDEFEENGKDHFRCPLPFPRYHADPLLYCLD
jgi:hypothetical protein